MPFSAIVSNQRLDSLGTVEMVMLIKELFEIAISERNAEEFGSFREIVDYLDAALTGKTPNKRADAMLRHLAKTLDRPELVPKKGEPWRWDQIAAIIRKIEKGLR